MRFKNRNLFAAVSMVTILLSFRAVSETQLVAGTYDQAAFRQPWSGKYYAESSLEEDESFFSFEEKRKHYLDSSTILNETEEFTVDEAGQLVPVNDSLEPEILPSPIPSLVPYNFLGFPASTAPNPFIIVLPTPVPTSVSSPIASPVAVTDPAKPQAFYYYNRGSLQNALPLQAEGKGFVKVFRDRDEKIGGRGWGTHALVTVVKELAQEFSEKFPGRERLQIADMARQRGGPTTHASHQTGLEADIVFIRKNRKEQPAFGGYGKNGFAEQFVIPEVYATRTIRDSQGRKRVIHSKRLSLSSNFDIPANFELLLIASEIGSVKRFFVDKVIIRELFRWSEETQRSSEPGVREMLMKLDHQASHADHFHIRLMCQDTDTKCVSETAMPQRRSKKRRS